MAVEFDFLLGDKVQNTSILVLQIVVLHNQTTVAWQQFFRGIFDLIPTPAKTLQRI